MAGTPEECAILRGCGLSREKGWDAVGGGDVPGRGLREPEMVSLSRESGVRTWGAESAGTHLVDGGEIHEIHGGAGAICRMSGRWSQPAGAWRRLKFIQSTAGGVAFRTRVYLIGGRGLRGVSRGWAWPAEELPGRAAPAPHTSTSIAGLSSTCSYPGGRASGYGWRPSVQAGDFEVRGRELRQRWGLGS